MIKKNLLLLVFVTCIQICLSQKQTNFWHFGTLAGLDFNTGSPVVLTNAALNTAEGCSSISDASGNLLFYTDGIKVWNKLNVQMPNGFGLLGDPSTTQSALIVPDPGNANLFYIFTLPAEGGGSFRYSVVDMSLNSGNGDVTVKNTFLKSNVTEKMTAVHHCNGHDIWVTIHEVGTNSFYSYLVTNTGINPPVVSNVGAVHTDVHGQMKFNSSGTMIACAIDTNAVAFNVGNGFADLCAFDKSTGSISYLKRITTFHRRTYGVEFSPDDSKFYLGYYDPGANSYVSQFDLTASDIQASEVLINTSFNPDIYSIQLAPDRKIYVTKEVTPFLDVINNPNLAGIACNYASNVINLDPSFMGNMCMLGLPAFIQSYLNPNFPNIPCTIPVTANFINSDTTLCKGDCISFTDQSTGTVTGWNWLFQGATPASSTAQNPATVCYPSAGTFTVRLIASNSSTSDTVIKTITVVVPTLSAGPDVVIAPGGSTQLNATGNVTSFSWSPATGLNNPSISNPIASPSVTTTYMVTGSDSNNCPASSAVTVNVEVPEAPCGETFVPTGFSPNGDGENDIECVMGSCIVSMTFSVYDRWGEKVFESSDQLQCWDGKHRGQYMNTGIYVYHLKATLKNGDEINTKGNINLIR
jgi:gliding motility-associated-like protein